MLSDLEKRDYRRKRNAWGWLIAAGWIIYWCIQKTDGSIINGLGYGFMILVAIITAPFAFLISHYLARAVVEKQSEQRAENEAVAVAAQLQRAGAEQANRLGLLHSEAQQARNLIDRCEFIKKIGTVRDYLAVLATAHDDSKQLLIRQSIDKELRDLIVKHDPSAMSALIQRDEAVRISLATMLDALATYGPLSADALILQRAQSPAGLPMAWRTNEVV